MRILECCQVVVVCSWMRKCCSSRLSTAGKFVAETCKLFRTGYPPPPLPPPFPPNRHQQDTVPRTPFSCLADKHLSRWGWCPSSDNGRSGGVGQWPCPGRRPLSSTLIFNSNLCCHPSSNVIIVIIVTHNHYMFSTAITKTNGTYNATLLQTSSPSALSSSLLPKPKQADSIAPFFKRHHDENIYFGTQRNIFGIFLAFIRLKRVWNILEFGPIYLDNLVVFIMLKRSMMR